MAKYKIVVLSPAPEALLKMWATPIAQKYGIAIDEVEVVTFFEPNYEEIGRHGRGECE